MMADKTKLATKIGAGAVALCVPLVMYFEGYVPRSYRDPIGIVTACYGHTGPDVRMGQQYTQEQCEEILQSDLLEHAEALDCIDAPMTDGQKAAFLSFAFNVGEQKFCASTLVRKANAGDMPGACAELSRWTLAGGKELPGLVKRRAAERKVCES